MDTIIQPNSNSTALEVAPTRIPETVVEIMECDGKRYQRDESNTNWTLIPE